MVAAERGRTVKDYLEESGSIISPITQGQAIKETFAAKIVDGQIWITCSRPS